MKRAGNLFGAICEPENLRLAFWKASRGKRAHDDQRAYAANLEAELSRLRAGLLDGSFPMGDYKRFTIFEPKERLICAAAFRERVLHHAIMNVLEPWVEKWLVADSFACRKGKGQLAAVARAQACARRFRYFLKCDVKKYFDSVPHEGIESMLRRKIKDEAVVAWLMKIVSTYETTPGRGLPIGNLTSQHLANLFLDPVDRVRERRGGEKLGYVRYMDDFVFYADRRDTLKAVRGEVRDLLEKELGLAYKAEPFLNRTRHGMDFLGFRVFPGRIRAAKASLARFRRKSALYDRLLACGLWDEGTYQARTTALAAFLRAADTLGWRKAHLARNGNHGKGETAENVGLEPGETGRQLEQQRAELPVGQPQQQQPVQQQQRQRVPARLRSSTAGFGESRSPRSLPVPARLGMAGRDENLSPPAAGSRAGGAATAAGIFRRASGGRRREGAGAGGTLFREILPRRLPPDVADGGNEAEPLSPLDKIDDPVFPPVDQFPDVLPADFRDLPADQRRGGQDADLREKPRDPFFRLFPPRVFRNPGSGFLHAAQGAFRPDDIHFRKPARTRARAFSCGTVRPSRASVSACSISRRISASSRSASYASTSKRTEAALPFCVTTMGRCVRRACCMYEERAERNCVNGTMSSFKSSGRGVGMGENPFDVHGFVQDSVQFGSKNKTGRGKGRGRGATTPGDAPMAASPGVATPQSRFFRGAARRATQGA